MSNLTKIEKQIEKIIIEKTCISKMGLMIDKFIKGLESSNMNPNRLKIELDL